MPAFFFTVLSISQHMSNKELRGATAARQAECYNQNSLSGGSRGSSWAGFFKHYGNNGGSVWAWTGRRRWSDRLSPLLHSPLRHRKLRRPFRRLRKPTPAASRANTAAPPIRPMASRMQSKAGGAPDTQITS